MRRYVSYETKRRLVIMKYGVFGYPAESMATAASLAPRLGLRQATAQQILQRYRKAGYQIFADAFRNRRPRSSTINAEQV